MATALKLRFYGDPVLRKVAKPVQSVGPAERFLIQEMIRAMYDFDGSGLAATQIGVDQQIFVADAGDGPFAVINPVILKKSSKETEMEEGCLSLPKIRVKISRPAEVRVSYFDEHGRKIEKTLADLMARIFQHESDHLCGRMIVDYASKADLVPYKAQLTKLEALSRKPAKA
ncbi:MAG: peptide deformylase [Candidatus Omnitrophica bacterium]|nr:peptide deformylase [Candidatus Omnitrophota bacterium]